MMQDFFLAFVPMFIAVDALGMIPVFMSLTDGMSQAEKIKLIRHSTLTALFVALVFLWVGKQVFLWLGITISDFLVAGGAILFILSIRDLLTYGKQKRSTDQAVGAVPLAVPLIVGPAVFTTSLILLSAYGVYPTVASIIVNILLCSVILACSGFLSRILGEAGSHTLSKIASLLLGAIGIMMMRRGLTEIIQIFAAK